VVSRLIITTIYIVLITLTACALPFFGDFVALCGAIGFTPLDFILPSLAYLVARRPKWVFTWVLNISIIFIYSCVAIMGSIGAVRFISIDVGSYKLFSNV
jgi:amino acid permease